LPLIAWVYLYSNLVVKLNYFCKIDDSAVQGHSRSLISVQIESAYATSY